MRQAGRHSSGVGPGRARHPQCRGERRSAGLLRESRVRSSEGECGGFGARSSGRGGPIGLA
jgi:hypothetical protein